MNRFTVKHDYIKSDIHFLPPPASHITCHDVGITVNRFIRLSHRMNVVSFNKVRSRLLQTCLYEDAEHFYPLTECLIFNKRFTSHHAADWLYDWARVGRYHILHHSGNEMWYLYSSLTCRLAWRQNDIGAASVHKQPDHLEKTQIGSHVFWFKNALYFINTNTLTKPGNRNVTHAERESVNASGGSQYSGMPCTVLQLCLVKLNTQNQ